MPLAFPTTTGCLTTLTCPSFGPSTEGLATPGCFRARFNFAGNRGLEVATGLLVDAGAALRGQSTFLGLTTVLDAAPFHCPLFTGGHLLVQSGASAADTVVRHSTISDFEVTDNVQDVVASGRSS